jgi:hypothetical protein
MEITSAGEGVGELKHSHTAGGNVSCHRNGLAVLSKVTIRFSSVLLDTHPRELKTCSQEHLHVSTCSSKVEKTLTDEWIEQLLLHSHNEK